MLVVRTSECTYSPGTYEFHVLYRKIALFDIRPIIVTTIKRYIGIHRPVYDEFTQNVCTSKSNFDLDVERERT